MSKQWSAHLNGRRMVLVTLALLVAGAAVFAALYALSPSSPDQVGSIVQYGEAGGSGGGGGAGQVAVSGDGDSLPFTGLVAIPLLILAAALLASGSLLRRRARSSETE